ncbi:major facilitator superfamily domain-containing protein [Catenaria anguillulae PL171]|uniref:Major facilitator superfamily domain-containing protein n=1 Tax=Catenaria anguillulae PL171 TaxID=765915 RepID=A0A1Y2HTF8_9FUNG|nr:major facilitator superfamily domain-containing protein [Catenaria anguillulae PL171]
MSALESPASADKAEAAAKPTASPPTSPITLNALPSQPTRHRNPPRVLSALTASPPARRFLGFLYLHPSYSPTNFLVFLVATLLTVCIFVFLNASTSFVLSEILGITTGLGDASGSIAFYDELLSMLMVVVWGAVSDFIGRRTVYAVGFAIMGAALCVYPQVNNLYPQLLLARLLFAIGAAACSTMLTAVLADCAGKLRGRISGLVGLMSGLGALVGVFVLLPLPTSFEKKGVSLGRGVQYAFLITGGIALAFSIIFFFAASKHFGDNNKDLVHPATLSSTAAPASPTTSAPAQRASLTSRLSPSALLAQAKQGMFAAKDLRIMAAYAAGFAARGNTVIVTIFIPLWVNAYYLETGLCQVTGLDPKDEAAIKLSCRAAFTRSSIVGGLTQTFALIGAPVWGILIDRFSGGFTDDEPVAIDDGEQATAGDGNAAILGPSTRRSRPGYSTLPLLATCVIAFVGYVLLFLLKSPLNPAIYAIVFLVGFGEIGTVITSVAMVAARHIDPKIRGSVSGAYSLCGGLGILICTRIGGLLFDAWTYTAPFLLMAIVHAVVAVLSVAVIVVERREKARVEA